MQGSGWGHSVGMSQWGARAMAAAGRSVEQILTHYYPGTELGTRDASAPIRIGLRQNVTGTWVKATGGPLRWDACPDTPDGRTPDGQCEQEVATQPQGETWHICPLSSGTQRVQDVECGKEGFITHWTSLAPVLRVQHDGVLMETPGPIRSSFRRGAHDIIRARDAAGELVRAYHTVQNLPSIEIYLYGLAEVPASWEPAALQAQAVTGRTYAMRTAGNRPFCRCDLLATPLHQAYGGAENELANGGTWRQAVDDSRGKVLTYQGAMAETFYSSSHGGRSENIEDSWAYGTAKVPYLRSVDDPWSNDERNPHRSWTATVRNADVARAVSETAAGTVATVERLTIRSRTDGGSPSVIRVRGRTSTGQTVEFDYAGTRRIAADGTLSGKPAGARLRSQVSPTTGGASSGGALRLRSSQIRSLSFGPFDDDDGSIHEYAIVWANHTGIAQGRSATRYEPEGLLRRDQMATLLVKTFAIPPSDEEAFSDVAADNPHAAAIRAVAAAGVARGVGDGSEYDPSGPVTRAQMATFLARAAGWDTSATTTRFTDVPRNVHTGAIAAIDKEGVTTGCDTDRYCPTQSVTRGQMASFLYRLVRG
jgi:SpoIID/LytB domain protein